MFRYKYYDTTVISISSFHHHLCWCRHCGRNLSELSSITNIHNRSQIKTHIGIVDSYFLSLCGGSRFESLSRDRLSHLQLSNGFQRETARYREAGSFPRGGSQKFTYKLTLKPFKDIFI